MKCDKMFRFDYSSFNLRFLFIFNLKYIDTICDYVTNYMANLCLKGNNPFLQKLDIRRRNEKIHFTYDRD